MAKPFQMKPSYANPGELTINGYDAPDERGKAPKKEQFLTDGKAMLRSVSQWMGSEWAVKVTANRAGVAVSGEVMGYFRHPDYARQIYVQLSSMSFGGRDSDNLAVLVQIREDRRIVGANIWLNADMTSEELAEKLAGIAERHCK